MLPFRDRFVRIRELFSQLVLRQFLGFSKLGEVMCDITFDIFHGQDFR